MGMKFRLQRYHKLRAMFVGLLIFTANIAPYEPTSTPLCARIASRA